MIARILPYVASFAIALAISLALTPLVRELHRRLGMVDKPGPRRVNTVPVPRGGGLALVIASLAAFWLVREFFGLCAFGGLTQAQAAILSALAACVAAIGLFDDRFSLPPKVKLLGQVACAAGVWFLTPLGFRNLLPALPAWCDCLFTVFWLTGAMNAFNLIDGLDGLASGIAFIATLGMAGSLALSGQGSQIVLHLAFMGGLLGFLRYNYNPASVFLGDCGSMFIGFTMAALPLVHQDANSFLVSIGMPILAMGVPIFDTALAILRRSIRHFLNGRETGSGQVMTADRDHVHHRILRTVGLNQRKTAWVLYGATAALVAFGLLGMCFRSRAAGLYLMTFSVAALIVFGNISRIELFDAGRLLSSLAHTEKTSLRRRWARLSVPFYVFADLLLLVAIYIGICWFGQQTLTRGILRVVVPIRVASLFFVLVGFGVYRIVWARAMPRNYLHLCVACVLGAFLGGVIVDLMPVERTLAVRPVSAAYAIVAYVSLLFLRTVRPVLRSLLYASSCAQMRQRKDVSRVLVYGAGLHYQAFYRELVRHFASDNRVIVGLLDDDIVLRGQWVGEQKVLGTLNQAPEIINRVNADTVVIACGISSEWAEVVRKTLLPCGVRIIQFSYQEKELSRT